jgi:hypothetical protein
MIRLLVTAAAVSGLLRHLFGGQDKAGGRPRRKAVAGQRRKRKTIRRTP